MRELLLQLGICFVPIRVVRELLDCRAHRQTHSTIDLFGANIRKFPGQHFERSPRYSHFIVASQQL